MNITQSNSANSATIYAVLKMTALLVLGIVALLVFSPAFAEDAIPAVQAGSNTVLATIRIAAPVLAAVVFIGACVLVMIHKIGIGHLILIFAACVGIGAAEPIVRFAIALGQGG